MSQSSTQPKCVVFCGWRGSGKDTFSNYLVTSYQFQRYAFADTLKDYCAETYEVPREDFDHTTNKEIKISDEFSPAFNMSPRDLCIKVGKEYRDKDPNYWIKMVLEKMAAQTPPPLYVVSDCRYPNELNKLKEHFQDIDDPNKNNCLAIWIHRFSTPPSRDPSELSLSRDDCDIVLDNTKLLRYRALEEIITKFL